MVLEIDYLNLLPKEYKKALKKLNKKLETAAKFSVKNRLLQNFAENFTTLPEIWDYWFGLVCNSDSDEILTWHTKKIYERNEIDFPAVKFEYGEWPNYDNFKNSFLNLDDQKEELKTFIFLSHLKLRLAYDEYIENNDSPLRSDEILKKYKKSCEIYQEIIKVDIKDSKEFIKILLKTENIEFVINNIETHLAKNPWCQNLWKTYIEYLEDTQFDSKDFLQVLSRYCRLFLGDKEMKEKYQENIEKLSESLENIGEFWIDLIKFEFHFNSLESAKSLLQKALKANMKNFMKFFDLALDFSDKYKLSEISEMINDAKQLYLNENPNIIDESYKRLLKPRSCVIPNHQKLPFSIVVNLHILENLDYSHLRKLYQTSKYFYYKYRINLVHKFEIFNNNYYKRNRYTCLPSLEYSGDSLKLSPLHFDHKKYGNIWLTGCLKLYGRSYKISKLLSKLIKCSLKSLFILATKLTLNELKILNQSQTIEKLCISRSDIYTVEDDGVRVSAPMSIILFHFPKLRRFVDSNRYQSTPEGIERLLALDFEKKLDVLDIRFSGNVDSEVIYKFLDKNLAPNAFLNLYVSNGNFVEFKSFLIEKFNNWCLEKKPNLSWEEYIRL